MLGRKIFTSVINNSTRPPPLYPLLIFFLQFQKLSVINIPLNFILQKKIQKFVNNQGPREICFWRFENFVFFIIWHFCHFLAIFYNFQTALKIPQDDFDLLPFFSFLSILSKKVHIFPTFSVAQIGGGGGWGRSEKTFFPAVKLL